MISKQQIQVALRERGFNLANATRDHGAIQVVSDLIVREVPPLIQRAGISLAQLAANPQLIESTASHVHGKIPIPWKWVIGKKGTVRIVELAASGIGRGASTVASISTDGTSLRGTASDCPACGYRMNGDATFCDECGSRLPMPHPSLCQQCGATLKQQAKFCGKCGTPVAPSTGAEGPLVAKEQLYPESEGLLLSPLDLLIDGSPDEFLDVASCFGVGDWVAGELAAARVFADSNWDVVARCCRAYCLMQQNRHDEAISSARSLAPDAVPLAGRWYRYMALVVSLNMKDDLSAAFVTAEEAIKYFEEQNYPLALPAILSQKTNILKQQASVLSRDAARNAEAKPLVIEAIRCACLDRELCETFEMSEMGPDSQEEEISALARIAARVGLTRADLWFLDEMTGIEDWNNKYFSPGSLEGQAAAECWNMAIEALRENDRERALPWYQRAYEQVGEETANARAFKALVAYQYGVCMLKLQGLENVPPRQVPSQKRNAVSKIRALWNHTIQLYATLDDATRRQDEETIANVRKALMHDQLMHGQMLAMAGWSLADGPYREKAVGSLSQALDYLDGSYEEDRSWIVRTHERLAGLLLDMGRAKEAAGHAQWMLEHVSNLDSSTRSNMQAISLQGGASTPRDARTRLQTLLEKYPQQLRILKGENDVDSLDVMNLDMQGPFDNGDPEFTSLLARSLEAGHQVAVSAAGPKQVLALISKPGKRVFRVR
jgi:tetratricopeptide (TPR) repeat protein